MITVLRLLHRPGRDDRISSHVGLTARQFGADTIIFSGEQDDEMLSSLQDVRDRWGGDMRITYREDWRRVIEDFDGPAVHLTMYGLPFQEHLDTVQAAAEDAGGDILIVVGSGKVPSEAYDIVDYNLAVGHQPHSEVAALAVFLHAYTDGDWAAEAFPGAAVEVVPQAHGKKTVEPE